MSTGVLFARDEVKDAIDVIDSAQLDARAFLRRTAATLFEFTWAGFGIFAFALVLLSVRYALARCAAQPPARLRWQRWLRSSSIVYFAVSAAVMTANVIMVQLMALQMDALFGLGAFLGAPAADADMVGTLLSQQRRRDASRGAAGGGALPPRRRFGWRTRCRR